MLENFRPAFSPNTTDCPWVSVDDKHKDVDTNGIVTEFVSLKGRRLVNACHLLDGVTDLSFFCKNCTLPITLEILHFPSNLFSEKVLQKTQEMEFLRT